MIEIKNLTKIFKTKAKEKTIALDNVSFNIPDTGLVFVLGKSGSGKTTLLSLIGTLDNITSGDIIVDGISLKNIKEKEAASYRNEKIAFIYQDYHLIEELTVKENIALSLDLKQEEIGDKITDSLKDVGLVGYESRYPKELSGGEKQRIAIARAIVKNSPIILADEPTGNLDTITSKQIFELLIKLSKEKLILIVSHDLYSAENYADRIIKLSYGKVIEILKRNENSTIHSFIKDNILYLPTREKLNEEEQAEINDKISNIKGIKWFDNKFIKDDEKIVDNKENIPLKRHHLSFKKYNTLGFKFFKNKVVHTFIVSILLACLVNVLGLAQIIRNYPREEMIERHLVQQNIDNILIAKDYEVNEDFSKSSYELPIPQKDIDEFNSLPLKGHMYKKVFMGDGTPEFNYSDLSYNYLSCYCTICDKEYLNNIFNDGKEVEIIYNDTINDYGFYLTDFNADCILMRYGKYYSNYEDLLGANYLEESLGWKHGHINGIIKTNYKTRFASILDKYEDNKLSKIQSNKLVKDPLFQEFVETINNNLYTRYSFNPNFINDFSESLSTDYTWPGYVGVSSNDYVYDTNCLLGTRYTKYWNKELKNHDIIISVALYYLLTGIELNENNYEEKFKPITINLDLYDVANYKHENPKQQIPLNVVEVDERISATHYILIGDDLQIELNKLLNTSYLYFDNIEDLSLVTDKAKELGYHIINSQNNAYREIVDRIITFSDLFGLINYILIFGILLLLVMIALRTIKDQMHNIGVLKSLGANNSDLMKIFSVRILSICILTSLIYILTSTAFIKLADYTLYNSIISIIDDLIISDFELIIPNYKILLMNILFIFIIGFISFIIENIKLSKIKPINIIKAKE